MAVNGFSKGGGVGSGPPHIMFSRKKKERVFSIFEKEFTMVSAVRFVELIMPIVVEAVPRKDYGSRVSNQLTGEA